MEFDATFIIAAISFILFTFVMNKIFYAPVMKIMEDRDIYVAANYKEAEELKEKINTNIDLKNSQLEETRNEGRKIISDKTNSVKKQKTDEIHIKKQNTVENITKMRDELIEEAKKSQDVLMANVVDISKEISGKILGEDFSTEYITPDRIDRG